MRVPRRGAPGNGAPGISTMNVRTYHVHVLSLTAEIERRFNVSRADARTLVRTHARRSDHIGAAAIVGCIAAAIAGATVWVIALFFGRVNASLFDTAMSCLLLVALVAPLWIGLRAYRASIIQELSRELSNRVCSDCGYDLRDLPATGPHRTCPECGTPNPLHTTQPTGAPPP